MHARCNYAPCRNWACPNSGRNNNVIHDRIMKQIHAAPKKAPKKDMYRYNCPMCVTVCIPLQTHRLWLGTVPPLPLLDIPFDPAHPLLPPLDSALISPGDSGRCGHDSGNWILRRPSAYRIAVGTSPEVGCSAKTRIKGAIIAAIAFDWTHFCGPDQRSRVRRPSPRREDPQWRGSRTTRMARKMISLRFEAFHGCGNKDSLLVFWTFFSYSSISFGMDLLSTWREEIFIGTVCSTSCAKIDNRKMDVDFKKQTQEIGPYLAEGRILSTAVRPREQTVF